MSPSKMGSLCFQDVLTDSLKYQDDAYADDNNGEENVIANAFFDLANAPMICYRIAPSCEINIQQDVSACGEHTGGIVWETSYLLLDFLRATGHSCQRLLEVGAGCGLVGLGCHKSGDLAKEVIITETQPVMDNLIANWERNYPSKEDRKDPSLRICELDWNTHRQDCNRAEIRKHSVDTIVGTDVVFATSLVEPLLKTMRYLAHDETVAYLCLQERCKDAHQLLLEKAKDHDFDIQDISENFAALSNCKWGKDLDCRLLKLTVAKKRGIRKRRKLSKEMD
jgi:hypothetical protein